MGFVIFLILTPLMMFPLLIYNDALQGEFEYANRERAKAYADAGLAHAITRVKQTNFQGVARPFIPSAIVVYSVTATGPTTRRILAHAYASYGLFASCGRVEADIETTDGGASWHVVGGRRYKVGVLHNEHFPVSNERTGS